jgi:hypothetical protein
MTFEGCCWPQQDFTWDVTQQYWFVGGRTSESFKLHSKPRCCDLLLLLLPAAASATTNMDGILLYCKDKKSHSVLPA